MTSNWQIWYMRPEWLTTGRFWTEKPDPSRLEFSHVHVADYPDRVPDMHILRDYKDHVWNRQQKVYWRNAGRYSLYIGKGVIHTNMALGDVLVSPAGVVWVVTFWSFLEVGKRRRSGTDGPYGYSRADVSRLEGEGRLPVIKVHHADPRAPAKPDQQVIGEADSEYKRRWRAPAPPPQSEPWPVTSFGQWPATPRKGQPT
jgi:hypothetical protein